MIRSSRLWSVVTLSLAFGLGACSSSSDDQNNELPPGVCDPGKAPMRMLTRSQFNNAVRDLLGDTSRPADAFPAPSLSTGFDNNVDLVGTSELSVRLYADVAEKLATKAVQKKESLLPCNLSRNEKECVAQFIDKFATRAYRRPLEIDEKSLLLGVFTDARASLSAEESLSLLLQVILQSPQFLYQIELGVPKPGAPLVALSPYEIASRLSFLIWNSIPDEALLAAAEKGKLSTPEGVATEARRLLKDEKAKEGIRNFYAQWLELGNLEGLQKNPAYFPSYDETMATSMRIETEKFLDDILWSKGKLPDLFTKTETFVDDKLAALYGVEIGSSSDGWAKVALDPAQRSGILTQASWLAIHAHKDQTSPTRRGFAIRTRILCQEIPPPPPGVSTVVPDVNPTSTTKERMNQHASQKLCAGCHRMLDKIGFGFENYDGIGKYRTTEGNNLPIDATGTVIGTPDLAGDFTGAVELSKKLAKSATVERCFQTQLFRYAQARTEADVDSCSIKAAIAQAGASASIVDIIVATTQTQAFLTMRPVDTKQR